MNGFVPFRGEIRKNLQIMWSYRVKALLDTFGFALMYIAAMFLLGGGSFDRELLQPALIGFLTSFYILETLSQMDKDITMRAQTGTLEQMYLGIASPVWLLIALILSIQLKSTFVVCIMGAVLALLFGIDLSFIKPAGILLLLITLIGVFGFGFFIAGMTVIYKQIGALTNILFNLILFLNGTFLPVEAMPDWMKAVSLLLPTTQGIRVMRQVLLDGVSLGDALQDGGLTFLILHSVLYLFLGIGFYLFAQSKARHEGSLGHY